MSDEFVFAEQNDEFDWRETSKGDPGATFIPAVSEQGIISWTNNGGLPNPESRNIKGPKGDDGNGVPSGGTTGQVLKKRSNTDYDVEWSNGGGTQVQSDWNESDTDDPAYIKNKPTIPAAQIQSDWSQSDNTQKDFIKNKPTIPAAQVNSDWNASSGVAEILNKPSIPVIDATLSTTGQAADAKATGDEIGVLRNTLNQLEEDVTALNTLTSVTPTINPGVTWGNSSNIYKNSNMAICNFNFTVSEDKHNGDILLSGLPLPVQRVYLSGFGTAGVRFLIETNGSLVLQSGFPTSAGWMNLTAAYFLA